MKYIISESQYHTVQVRRRIEEIKGLIKDSYAYQYPCDYEDFDTFLNSIIYGIKHELSLDWINDENFDYVKKIITGFLKDELHEYYISNCEKSEKEMSEYSRTLKNARKQGVGLRFPKVAIKYAPKRFRPYNR